MSDLPARITIHEEGPREGSQIETNPIAVADEDLVFMAEEMASPPGSTWTA